MLCVQRNDQNGPAYKRPSNSKKDNIRSIEKNGKGSTSNRGVCGGGEHYNNDTTFFKILVQKKHAIHNGTISECLGFFFLVLVQVFLVSRNKYDYVQREPNTCVCVCLPYFLSSYFPVFLQYVTRLNLKWKYIRTHAGDFQRTVTVKGPSVPAKELGASGESKVTPSANKEAF